MKTEKMKKKKAHDELKRRRAIQALLEAVDNLPDDIVASCKTPDYKENRSQDDDRAAHTSSVTKSLVFDNIVSPQRISKNFQEKGASASL